MKPLSLSLTAFGSYPGTETVDFTALSPLGLFVVTGPTGSGKTTVFDAMAYALYGEVPGVRDPGDVRSHHAAPGVLCSVTFRFEVDGETYRVERSPEQFRAAKRGGADLVRKAASALLVRESDDVTLATKAGTATKELKSTDSGKVADACVRLVGLTSEQFERVVLLPQGRFQQFLLADTKERQPLLRQLFGTARWLRVIERLRERMNEAKAEVAAVEGQLGNHRYSLIGNLQQAAAQLDHVAPVLDDEEAAGAATLDELEQVRVELETAAVDRRTASRAAEEAARVASELEATAQRVVEDWTARRELRAESIALSQETPAIDELRLRLAADDRARPVIAAIAPLDEATRAATQAAGAATEARVQVVEACATAGLEPSDSPAGLIAAVAEARSAAVNERNALDAAVAARARCDDLSTQLTDATATRTGITERLAELDLEQERRSARLDECAPIASLLGARQLAATTAAERLTRAERVAELVVEKDEAAAAVLAARDAHRDLLDRFVADAAPRLAAELVDDEPCPVCGATEHPAPASAASGGTVDAAALDVAGRAVSEAAGSVERLDAELQMLQSSLGDDAGLSIEQLTGRVTDAKAALLEAESAEEERAALTTEIAAGGAQREQLVAQDTELDRLLVRLGTEHEAAVNDLVRARGELGALAERFDTEGAALTAEFDRRAAQFDQLEFATTAWSTAITDAERADGALHNAGVQFNDALGASGFADRDAAEAAAIDVTERPELAARVAAFETRRMAVDLRLPELEALELPEDCPDITELRTDAAAKRDAAALLASELARLEQNLERALEELGAARALTADAAEAFARSDQLSALAKTCDGQGPRKVSLETWVLAGELDRVVLAATVHLQRMTSGRYRLERTDAGNHGNSQAGLDLRVFDAHTGLARRPASLSGGEQFQASLALALGLADVVSHGGSASGRTFEALFVDEGFGSLDPESLAQAVDALHQIRDSGRTVGVITHVEAMKEDLPLGIRVERLGDGNGSTLHCHPEI
jgi:exonuclease SbcC